MTSVLTIARGMQMRGRGLPLFPASIVNVDCVHKSELDDVYRCCHSLQEGFPRTLDVMIGGRHALVCDYGDVAKSCAFALRGTSTRVQASWEDLQVAEREPAAALVQGGTTPTTSRGQIKNELFKNRGDQVLSKKTYGETSEGCSFAPRGAGARVLFAKLAAIGELSTTSEGCAFAPRGAGARELFERLDQFDGNRADYYCSGEFYDKQTDEAKEQGVLFSLHLKAYYKDVFAKHGVTFEKLGVDVNNGLGGVRHEEAAVPFRRPPARRTPATQHDKTPDWDYVEQKFKYKARAKYVYVEFIALR
jgi:hypothetical protein